MENFQSTQQSVTNPERNQQSTTDYDKSKEAMKETKEQAKQAVSEAKETMASVGTEAKRVGGELASEAKQMFSETVDEAKGQVKSTFTDQKAKAAEGLSSVAGALRRTSEELASNENPAIAHYAEAAADQVERFSGYLKNQEVGQVVNDLRTVAQRQPELFVAGALAAGFLLGRFLKSSGSQQMNEPYKDSGYGYGGQPSNYGATSGSYPRPTYTGVSSTNRSWERNEPSATHDIPIKEAEGQYGQ